MRQGRLRDGPFADVQKVGTIEGAIGGGDIREDGDPHRIGEGVEYALDGDVFNRGMKQRPHTIHNVD